MPTEQRIRLCLLIEKIYEHREFSEKLGLEDKTTFRGQYVRKEEEKKVC